MRVDTAFEPLVTERLHLRRSRPEDAETISAYRRDPEVHRYQGWERTDPEGIRAEIEEMVGRAPGKPGGWVQLSVLERASERLVGDVGFSRVDGEPGVIKVGYTMAPTFQGRGYGTEAMRALAEERVRVVLASLTPNQRDVLLLRILGGLTLEEVATVVRRKPGAVKALQARGLAAIRRNIERGAVTL